MQLTYRQGLLRGQVHPTLHVSNFLVKNDDYVDILAEPTALLAVASHKTKNYLIQEHKSNGEAWGPLPQNVNCLLYWDIDKSSGLVTRGFTTGTFSYGINAPSNPSVGQHWFDLANDVMKVWDGTYWDEMIRVFAGVYNSTSPTVTHFQFTSQVNDFTSARGGYIYYDANHRGIKDPLTGTFLNTGDGLILQAGSLNLPVKPDASVVYLTSAEPIPTKSLVCVNSNGKLELASASAEKYAVGMVEDDSPVETSTRLITNGIVYYEQWNFDSTKFGKPIYLGETGQFTFTPSIQYIGIVLTKNAILLAPATQINIENVNVDGGGSGGGSELSSSTGSSMVGYLASGAGAVTTTVQSKLRESFSAIDYGFVASQAALSPIVGSIRNNGGGVDAYDYWKIINYSGHAPIGFRNELGSGKEIETTTSYIRVHHDIGGNITAGVIASLDETLAQTGIRIGTSVGENYTDIYMYRDIEALITKSAGGVWNISYENGVTSVAYDSVNKYLVVDHKETPNAAINVTQQGSGSLGGWVAQATQVSSTQSRIYFMRNQELVHSARVAWNGSAFATYGNAKNISVTSYDTGTGDLILTLTSGDCFAYDVSVSPYNQGTIRPVIKANDATTVTINFYDNAGSKITASPTTACAFVVRAQSKVLNDEPGNSTNFAVRWNSRSQINPRLINSVDYPAGNIWVLGYTGRNTGRN